MLPEEFSVITGGQTGADQGALRAARACDISTGGWAPRGWMTEDGPAPWLANYCLEECSGGYRERTRKNVEGADALLWFGDPNSPGGKLTISLAIETAIPVFRLITDGCMLSMKDVAEWLEWDIFPAGDPIFLLVAGNRESKSPGIGKFVEEFMREVFRLMGA